MGSAVLSRQCASPLEARSGAVFRLLLCGASLLLIFTAIYITWDPVGARLVTGIQGRYFIPVLIVAVYSAYILAPVARLKPPPASWGHWLVAGYLSAELAGSLTYVALAYHLFDH